MNLDIKISYLRWLLRENKTQDQLSISIIKSGEINILEQRQS